MKHRIDLTNTIPFKERHRRIPHSMVEEVRKRVSDLVASRVIRKYISALVLCRKKNGNLFALFVRGTTLYICMSALPFG